VYARRAEDRCCRKPWKTLRDGWEVSAGMLSPGTYRSTLVELNRSRANWFRRSRRRTCERVFYYVAMPHSFLV